LAQIFDWHLPPGVIFPAAEIKNQDKQETNKYVKKSYIMAMAL